jgi:hypothetical protein
VNPTQTYKLVNLDEPTELETINTDGNFQFIDFVKGNRNVALFVKVTYPTFNGEQLSTAIDAFDAIETN